MTELGSYAALPAVKAGGKSLTILIMRYEHVCISELITQRLETMKIFSTNGTPFIIVADRNTSENLLRDLPRFAKSHMIQYLPDGLESDQAMQIYANASVLICQIEELMITIPPVPYTLFFAKLPAASLNTWFKVKALLERVARSGVCNKAYFCTNEAEGSKRERKLRERLENEA